MYIYKIIILCGLLLGSVGLKAQEAQCSIDRKLRADSTNRNRIITRATMYGVGYLPRKHADDTVDGRQRVSANFLPGRLGIYTQQSRQ